MTTGEVEDRMGEETMATQDQVVEFGDALDLSGTDEAEAAARARALSSPVRWRILGLCLHEERTNKELADLLEVNPGSMLHHVRTLVATGYLEAREPRRGARNALEIPYLASQLTREAALGDSELNAIMREALEHETSSLPPEEARVWRVGLHLDDGVRAELEARLGALFEEFAERGTPGDPGARAWSLAAFLHPDPNPLPG